MKRTRIHFAVAYLTLVALPLLGLVGVLKSGRALTAPVSVEGVWTIQPDREKEANLSCPKFLSSTDTKLIISQSGRDFSLSVPNAVTPSASGVVEGNKIRAAIVAAAPWARQAGCDQGTVIKLTAIVDPKANLLAGVGTAENCSNCAPVRFRAIREDKAKTTGAD
jgi:hypothetical protein